jgi:hypothetical protein
MASKAVLLPQASFLGPWGFDIRPAVAAFGVDLMTQP